MGMLRGSAAVSCHRGLDDVMLTNVLWLLQMLTVVDVGVVRACVTIVIAFLLVIMFIVASVANSLIVLLFVRRRGMRTLPNR